ncbi:hypothetical protein [Sodalis ligni]|uniref:Uncharacterized protein n=1 Tax=Sodalis ligni TaxID=2697027 RepID=A0A4R1NHE6_9GAMM|nr:hypothetical protein [Sodalis ligni]TCL07155.1 hypothetical protein EZJ58_5467 [Sodalis ligni]
MSLLFTHSHIAINDLSLENLDALTCHALGYEIIRQFHSDGTYILTHNQVGIERFKYRKFSPTTSSTDNDEIPAGISGNLIERCLKFCKEKYGEHTDIDTVLRK